MMRNTIQIVAMMLVMVVAGCKKSAESADTSMSSVKISLAQWSLHQAIQAGTVRPDDFASIAKNDYGIDAVEYVASFYMDHKNDAAYWKSLRAKSDSLGVKNLLIMVDGQGDLGNPDSTARNEAVKNHFAWVDAAAALGCHSIRINAFGEGTADQVKDAMVDALKKLCAYAADRQINVIIENHGLYSADGKWVADVIQKVGMSNVGTLPDFGNWCLSAMWGSTEPGKNCQQAYDRYQGVTDMLPFAKGVSAKSYDFSEDGNETIIDYAKMASIVKAAGYDGYVGIEYEGTRLSEPDGILATKALIQKAWSQQPQP